MRKNISNSSSEIVLAVLVSLAVFIALTVTYIQNQRIQSQKAAQQCQVL